MEYSGNNADVTNQSSPPLGEGSVIILHPEEGISDQIFRDFVFLLFSILSPVFLVKLHSLVLFFLIVQITLGLAFFTA